MPWAHGHMGTSGTGPVLFSQAPPEVTCSMTHPAATALPSLPSPPTLVSLGSCPKQVTGSQILDSGSASERTKLRSQVSGILLHERLEGVGGPAGLNKALGVQDCLMRGGRDIWHPGLILVSGVPSYCEDQKRLHHSQTLLGAKLPMLRTSMTDPSKQGMWNPQSG